MNKYQIYYDKMYSTKDYSYEVDTVLSMVDIPKNILDVGCGTGNHVIQFIKRGFESFGIDPDQNMIKRALEKDKQHFKCGDVSEIDKQYDLVVSLFNVVNYIVSLDVLLNFFRSIYSITNRYFIFDCWNGLAVILDQPRKEVRKIDNITVVLEPRILLMDQIVEMTNKIYVEDEVKFEYTFNQRLWTPRILKDLLEMAGFKVHMFPWMKPRETITESTWKMMVKCER